jgi:ATP/ADP translocase
MGGIGYDDESKSVKWTAESLNINRPTQFIQSSALRTYSESVRSASAEEAVSKLELLFMFFFVLVRVISWIVRYAAKKNDPRNHTNHHETQQRADQTSNSSFDTLFKALGYFHVARSRIDQKSLLRQSHYQ